MMGTAMTSRSVVPLTLIAFVTLVAPVVAAAQDPVACGSKDEKHEVIKHKVAAPVPAPTAGKAMVVIVLGGSFTKSYQQKLAVNGQWRAVMNESQYSFFEVDPGEGQKLLRKKSYVTFEVRDVQ